MQQLPIHQKYTGVRELVRYFIAQYSNHLQMRDTSTFILP